MSGKDYIAQVKIRNGPMLRAMRRAGYQTAADLWRADPRLTQTQIGELLNLQAPAIQKCGAWRPIVLRLADLLKCMPEDLFPPQHIDHPLERNTAEFEISVDEVAGFLTSAETPETLMIAAEQKAAALGMLDELPDRERLVIQMRYGFDGEGSTFDEIAAAMGGISRERVRQIEQRALERLRHPGREREIRGLA